MKIEYNILWLDDAKQEIEEGEYHFELFDFVKGLGFLPQIELVRTEQEFFEILNIKQWDLIMTDYNLDEISENPEKGDEVIKKIREQDLLTEILFYTKKDDEDRKVGFNRITFIDTSKMSGTVHNEKVLLKAKEIIELTVKKFQNIVAMRGMIMHETSSLDVEMENILQKIVDGSEAPEEVIATIKKKYIKSNEEFNKNIDKVDDIESILRTIGASHRWRAIVRNLSDGEIKSIMADYEKEIILIRNKFAHAELIDDGERQYFRDRKNGLDFNEDFCKKVREDLLKHKGNIDSLNSELGK